MKISVFITVCVLIFAIACFAQETAKDIQPQQQGGSLLKAFTGEIESITYRDTEKKTQALLTVSDKKGNKSVFAVADGARIRSKADTAIRLTDLSQGDSVRVVYHTTYAGKNIATLIALEK